MTHQGVTPTRAQCANYAWDMLSLAQNIVDELEATVTTRPNPLPSLTANLGNNILDESSFIAYSSFYGKPDYATRSDYILLRSRKLHSISNRPSLA